MGERFVVRHKVSLLPIYCGSWVTCMVHIRLWCGGSDVWEIVRA